MIRQMFHGMAVAAVLSTQALGADPAGAKPICMRPDEVTADQIRFIETELRIAAQQCVGGKNIDLPDLYTSFVLEKRPYLARSERPLTLYLKRKGKQDLSSYLNTVASRVSYESANVSQFCSKSRLAAEVAVKSADPSILLSLLPIPYQRPAELCQSS
ncbi:hypothetical protein [Kordiimonas marina]|uniref:hypothetical protein n=1 Tax=Kordiimonas marina TaxID=2872312 RepID=UPI001FF3D03B|nr:hypothetical protein [Kordiimonas marina]MCJ9430230.1 hypothetical protein [Kordiimonas marina]